MDSPIRRINVSDSIVELIRKQIESGQLKPGDRLPAERELCLQYGVSRISVREAIKILSAQQLVEVRSGEGSFVKFATASALVDPLLSGRLSSGDTIQELQEVRRSLEAEIAHLAALRATEADLSRMQTCVTTMEAAATVDPEVFMAADLEFHVALVESVRNKVLRRLYDGIVDMTRESRKKTAVVPGTRDRAIRAHRAIYEAVAARDPEAARTAMCRHMSDVEQDIRVITGD